MVEEDDCRPDVVELVRTNVTAVCNATNLDDRLSGGVPRTLRLNQIKSQMLVRTAGQ